MRNLKRKTKPRDRTAWWLPEAGAGVGHIRGLKQMKSGQKIPKQKLDICTMQGHKTECKGKEEEVVQCVLWVGAKQCVPTCTGGMRGLLGTSRGSTNARKIQSIIRDWICFLRKLYPSQLLPYGSGNLKPGGSRVLMKPTTLSYLQDETLEVWCSVREVA